MLNKEIYQALEAEFERNRIGEDVEEILLELAEALSEREILDKEIQLTESYGKTQINVTGICSEEEGEISVFIKQVRVGKKEFVIEDYLL